MTIGERIKLIRGFYGMTSNEFAEVVGVHPVTIRKYETQKMEPRKEHINKMCEALKLPRMIFEGIPQEYADYSLRGDFYQLLFLLLSTKTIYPDQKLDKSLDFNVSAFDNSFLVNPKLSEYITIKDKTHSIPLSELRIELNKCTDNGDYDGIDALSFILALNHNIDREFFPKDSIYTKEEYLSELIKHKERLEIELMLMQHNTKQYVTGIGTFEQARNTLDNELKSGGTYKDYLDKADLTQSQRDSMMFIYSKYLEKNFSEIDAQNEALKIYSKSETDDDSKSKK